MHHVIIGQGPAGVIAAETLRQIDKDASITLIGNEHHAPYSRMAIPYYLTGNIKEDGTHLRHDPEHFQSLDIELVDGNVTQIGLDAVTLENGEHLNFDRLLIAAGSHAIRPPVPGIDLAGVENCWTIQDAHAIAARAQKGCKVLLMGAGFIGCIVLEAMKARGVELTIVEAQDRMVPRMMDETGGKMIKDWCEAKGVKVLTGTLVKEIASSDDQLNVSFSQGVMQAYDLVVCASGVQPNIAFLDGSGIETDDGILVDKYLRTNIKNIFAAGDIAQGPEFFSGKQEIHAIQPTASEHGRIAALNMAGLETPYQGSLSMNVLSTLGLVSTSYGQWMGVAGGDEVIMADPERFKYIKLAFEGDVLVGALSLGFAAHPGVMRGLMQSKTRLGPWKDILMKEPTRLMEAWLACTQGGISQSMAEAAVA
ncbi:MAG TPA: NAD(P)/FAD-dependent oxidoreductase [Rhizobiales bacterium]|nr:NAD(P)/FAD-dependent oxidoreductase [Hyphomicrobiales bacterium]